MVITLKGETFFKISKIGGVAQDSSQSKAYNHFRILSNDIQIIDLYHLGILDCKLLLRKVSV